MRFRHQQDSSIPAINLIPMLNVLLGVLAFFVIITLTLDKPRGVTVQLPASADAPLPEEEPELEEEEPIPPMIVNLGNNGQYLVDDTPVLETDLDSIVLEYLADGDDALVFLTADDQVPYQDVMDFLIEMKQLGDDRVSLALKEES